MKRYIDAYKIPRHGKRGGECYWQEIEQLPTADVVEVVRCKDCKYTAKGGNESEFWNICTLRPLVYVPVSDEDYCSRGEKKDDGRNNS